MNEKFEFEFEFEFDKNGEGGCKEFPGGCATLTELYRGVSPWLRVKAF